MNYQCLEPHDSSIGRLCTTNMTPVAHKETVTQTELFVSEDDIKPRFGVV